jgi:plastocyanin
MRRRTMFLVALLSACAVLAAGCGDDDSDDSGAGGGGDEGSGSVYGGGGGSDGQDEEQPAADAGQPTTLRLTADPGGALKFDKSSLRAKPGKVTIVLDNPSQLPHAIEVEGGGVEEVGKTVEQGGVSRVTAQLEAGEYEFYCPVGNHADAGMEGTLTVR